MSFAAIPGPLATRWVRRIAFPPDSLRRFDASLAAILTRSACRTLSSPLVPGGLTAGRRLLPCPLFIASQDLRFEEAGLSYGSRFPFSPCLYSDGPCEPFLALAGRGRSAARGLGRVSVPGLCSSRRTSTEPSFVGSACSSCDGFRFRAPSCRHSLSRFRARASLS
jgi:hypothetical protein